MLEPSSDTLVGGFASEFKAGPFLHRSSRKLNCNILMNIREEAPTALSQPNKKAPLLSGAKKKARHATGFGITEPS